MGCGQGEPQGLKSQCPGRSPQAMPDGERRRNAYVLSLLSRKLGSARSTLTSELPGGTRLQVSMVSKSLKTLNSIQNLGSLPFSISLSHSPARVP